MSKSVCIIGAGPSGIVAAKTLLHNAPDGSFEVSLYDTQAAIGGLWPVSRSDTQRQVHPLMIVNQSKHTMHFSDMAWEDDAPQFPQAWMVGQYLQKYHDHYLAGNPNFELRLETRVDKAQPKPDSPAQWEVVTTSADGSQSRDFDHVIVSSGFFGKPIIPQCLSQVSNVPVVHSSQYRDLKGLLGTDRPRGGKILVVGGQMSGVEIAGTIAQHLSSAINAPDKSEIPDIANYSIHHIVQRPVWVFPLYTSPIPGVKAAPFLPLDLSSYNLNNRVKPLADSQGHISEETAKVVNGIFEGVLGTNQSVFSPLLQTTEETNTNLPYLVVSDWYCDFIRSGLITLSNGKLESFAENTATIGPDGSKVDDIAAIVVATGFDPSACLDFFPNDILQKLQHSPEYIDLPVALNFHGTHHKDVPGLGFVGFYRSPYWGVMHMQARFLAQLWTKQRDAETFREMLEADGSADKIVGLRGDPRVAQFPMGDYAWLMQEFAKALSIKITQPSDGLPAMPHNQLPLDTLVPARYTDPTEGAQSQADANKSLEACRLTALSGLTTPRFVARGVFRSLLGIWKLERDLVSELPSHPSGHFSGTAQFLLREKTKDGLQCAADPESAIPNDEGLEYLYIESGEFKTESGFSFQATRRYVWRYDEARDVLSVWFAKPDDLSRADYLFHEIEFEQPDEDRNKGWAAKAGHLCEADFYNVKYNFAFRAVNLDEWSIQYAVKGPKKNYTIRGVYKR